MRFTIKHESARRIRVHFFIVRLDCEDADLLQDMLLRLPGVYQAKVYERTSDATIIYNGNRTNLIESVQNIQIQNMRQSRNDGIVASSRRTTSEFQEQLLLKISMHYVRKWFLPFPLRVAHAWICSVPYVLKGLNSLSKGKLEVSVLDAIAISVSMIRKNYSSASSVMFLLGIGELLENWTQKKSVQDLAKVLSLKTDKVWIKLEDEERLVSVGDIKIGDVIVVHTGNVIPFDGIVLNGEAMVNQSSLTGENIPAEKRSEAYVFAGTVIEEGRLEIEVCQTEGNSRYEKISHMIEETDKLKSGSESRAQHLADKLVPYSLGVTALTYLLTGNATKALSVLMVDFSCALKLAMPIAVLSSIREAAEHQVIVKGGKFLETVAEADTIVFDKTGTLTKAEPKVVRVVSFCEMGEDEILRLAACLEEHFPHSIARAVVEAALQKGLVHDEMHSDVEYIVAHGISSSVNGQKVVIGSYHFVFEDEKSQIPEGKEELFHRLPEEYSLLYLSINKILAGVICIEDTLREETAGLVERLKESGLTNVVMMTGDNEKTAGSIARRVGIERFYAEVLPEDKVKYIEQEKESGHTVVMVGDGINDSPALSAADVGISVRDGAEIAKEIADIMINTDNLNDIILLKRLSDMLKKRITANYSFIISFNVLLILLGIGGVLAPSTSALLHNSSTLLVGLKSMGDLLE